jgi:hypothetical protein
MPNGAPKRVTGGEAANDEPSLSPDGRWLAFHSTRHPPASICSRWPLRVGAPRLLVAGGRARAFRRTAVDRLSEHQREQAGTFRPPTRACCTACRRREARRCGWPGMHRRCRAPRGAPIAAAYFSWQATNGTMLRLWSAPLDGGPAAMIPEFSEARACGRARLRRDGRSVLLHGHPWMRTTGAGRIPAQAGPAAGRYSMPRPRPMGDFRLRRIRRWHSPGRCGG